MTLDLDEMRRVAAKLGVPGPDMQVHPVGWDGECYCGSCVGATPRSVEAMDPIARVRSALVLLSALVQSESGRMVLSLARDAVEEIEAALAARSDAEVEQKFSTGVVAAMAFTKHSTWGRR